MEYCRSSLDVFSEEPPKVVINFFDLPNFVLTPHIGAYTKEATERMVMQSTQNLIEMLDLEKK